MVNQYYGIAGTHLADIGEARRQVEWSLEQLEHNAGRFVIADKANNEYIGDIGFSEYIKAHRRIELGYRLFSEYWGKGIMIHFIRQLVTWGFDNLPYNRIEAVVDVRNEASKKALLKNYFVYEGALRQM